VDATETLEDRIAEIEQRQTRFVLASSGTDGWVNFIESRLLQERQFEHGVLTEVIASLRREFEVTAKCIADQAAARHVRGTYDEKIQYAALDIVARDGGSFVARRDNPGKCPGEDWQLIARQGARGIAGPKGERGEAAPRISGWKINLEGYSATPIMSDGKDGPPLELRSLFEKYNEETTR
jgi:hypothetical protein